MRDPRWWTGRGCLVQLWMHERCWNVPAWLGHEHWEPAGWKQGVGKAAVQLQTMPQDEVVDLLVGRAGKRSKLAVGEEFQEGQPAQGVQLGSRDWAR